MFQTGRIKAEKFQQLVKESYNLIGEINQMNETNAKTSNDNKSEAISVWDIEDDKKVIERYEEECLNFFEKQD